MTRHDRTLPKCHLAVTDEETEARGQLLSWPTVQSLPHSDRPTPPILARGR